MNIMSGYAAYRRVGNLTLTAKFNFYSRIVHRKHLCFEGFRLINRLLLCLTLDKYLQCSGTGICYKAVYFCSVSGISDLMVLPRGIALA